MADWDEIYREKSVDESSAARVLTENKRLIGRAGSALDFASGLSANGVFLAQLGMQVTAWDSSAVAVEKTNQYAKQHGLTLTAEKKDLENNLNELQGEFDIIVVSFFLYRPAFEKLYELLKPGGLLFYQTFSGEQVNGAGPSRREFRLRRGELLQVFSRMELLFYRADPLLPDAPGICSDQVLFVAKK